MVTVSLLQLETVHRELGFALSDILVVSNYTSEWELDPVKDVLILSALGQMLWAADDFLEDLPPEETGRYLMVLTFEGVSCMTTPAWIYWVRGSSLCHCRSPSCEESYPVAHWLGVFSPPSHFLMSPPLGYILGICTTSLSPHV